MDSTVISLPPGQQPQGIQYAAVVYNGEILCSCSAGGTQYESTLEKVIPQVDTTRVGEKTVFNTHEGLAVHFLIGEQGVLFTCITSVSFPKQRAHACLGALVKNFDAANLFTRVVDAGPYGLMSQFSLALQVQMEKYSKPDVVSSGQAVINDLQAKVEEVKVVMVRNVQKIIDRGERLEDLQNHSESLEMRANQFRITATRVRKKMWWQNMKMKLAIGGIALLIIFIVVMAILGSQGVFDSDSSSSDDEHTVTTKVLKETTSPSTV